MSTFWAALMWGWRYRSLVLAALRMPKLPTDWRDSEQVRLFFIAFARSDVAKELTQITVTRWDDNVRERMASLAEQKSMWDLAWEIVYSAENTVVRKQTLRERIRARFVSRFAYGESAVPTSQLEGLEALTDEIQTLNVVFGKKQFVS